MALEELGKAKGDDIDILLMGILEDPNGFGVLDTARLQFVWLALARRGRPEIRDYLETFLADPENVDIGVKFVGGLSLRENLSFAVRALQTYALTTTPRKQALQYLADLHEQGRISTYALMDVMNELLEPDDTEFVWLLSEAVKRDWRMAPILAAEVLPDPCLVPVLKEALEREEPARGMLLQALFACGEKDEARRMGLAELEKYVGGDMRFWECYSLLRFLGTTGDESVFSSIEYLTGEDVIAAYRETVHPWTANELQQSAVLALGRLGSAAAIPRLKEIYQSQATEISVKIAAALSLYCLGDDAGHELLQHFVNHTERSVPGIEARWHVDMYGGKPFHEAIVYLRSPETDELFLERLRNGVGGSDKEAMEIVRSHKLEVLPVLVGHLASRDRGTRTNAHAMLKSLTGQDFGFDPGRFVGQQDEAIERWRSYVNDYLAGR